jgi:hypothetical protein
MKPLWLETRTVMWQAERANQRLCLAMLHGLHGHSPATGNKDIGQ